MVNMVEMHNVCCSNLVRCLLMDASETGTTLTSTENQGRCQFPAVQHQLCQCSYLDQKLSQFKRGLGYRDRKDLYSTSIIGESTPVRIDRAGLGEVRAIQLNQRHADFFGGSSFSSLWRPCWLGIVGVVD